MPLPAASSKTARKHRGKIGKVYAGRHGIIGALTEDMIDTSKESRAAIAALRHTPGGAFGSARYKLAGIDKNRSQYERLIDIFSRPRHRLFLLQRRQRFHGHGTESVRNRRANGLSHHLYRDPKDRRQRSAHHRLLPRVRSAAKYIAVSTREAALDVASMARTSTKVFVLEVMGRHAGWMAAAGGLAGEKAGDAPHVILFPEIVFDREKYLAKVKSAVEKYGYCVVVVSEGVRDSSGKISRRGRHQGRLRPCPVGRRGTRGRANAPGSVWL